MDALNIFMAKSVPNYAELFKSEHSESQALVLFENYLCYRALLDVLSLRVSRWEHLVKLLYHQVKDVLDEECTEWLRLVHLAVSIRDTILCPNQSTYSDVLKCMKVSSTLFSNQEIYKNFNDDLNRSIASYFVLVEKDKNKALETCDMNDRMMEVVLAFPNISPLQRSVLMHSKIPNFVLVAILDHLKLKVMNMQLPALVKLFSSCENVDDEEENEEEATANQMSSELMELSTDEIDEPTGVHGTETEDSEYQCASSNYTAATTTTTIATTTTTTSTATTTDDDDDDDNNYDSVAVDDKKAPVPKKYFLRERRNNDICIPDEDEPSNCSGALPEKQPVNNNNKADHVATGSEEDISEDDVSEEDKNFNPLVAPGKSRGVRHRWTELEVKNLLDGVEKFGVGNWNNICFNYYFLPCRNPVSLKDKWRNMLKSKEVPQKYLGKLKLKQ